MSVRVSGKHMEIGDSFRVRIGEQIEQAVTKYFDGGYSSQVTVEKSGSRFSADCKLHLDTGVVLQANGQANEPQSAFDAASSASRSGSGATNASSRTITTATGRIPPRWPIE